MRLAPLVVLAGVTSALLGCGSDDTTGGAVRPEARPSTGTSIELDEVDPCGALDAATASRLVGEPLGRQEDEDALLPTCAFTSEQAGDVGPLIQVLALPMGAPAGFADFDELVDTQRLGESTLEVEDVTVEGADRAALIDDEGYGLSSTTLVAVAGGVGYTVYAPGVVRAEQVRVAVAALTVLLGGELPDGAAVEPSTDDVCSLIDNGELSDAAGTRVVSEASVVGDSPVCTWTGDGLDVLVLDVGMTSRIESLVDLGGDDRSVTQLDVGPDSAAYVTRSELGISGYVATGRRLYSVDVSLADDSDDDAEAVRVLEQTLQLIAAGTAG